MRKVFGLRRVQADSVEGTSLRAVIGRGSELGDSSMT